MKHKIHIDAGIVVNADAGAAKSSGNDGQQPAVELDVLVNAIDLRANYVGPILEEILHISHEVWPSSLRK